MIYLNPISELKFFSECKISYFNLSKPFTSDDSLQRFWRYNHFCSVNLSTQVYASFAVKMFLQRTEMAVHAEIRDVSSSQTTHSYSS